MYFWERKTGFGIMINEGTENGIFAKNLAGMRNQDPSFPDLVQNETTFFKMNKQRRDAIKFREL